MPRLLFEHHVALAPTPCWLGVAAPCIGLPNTLSLDMTSAGLCADNDRWH